MKKKLQNMIGKKGEDAKTKDLQRELWRHLVRKKRLTPNKRLG